MTQRWLQIHGDPSVRRFLFDQERVANEFDLQIDEVLARVAALLKYHGIFHAKIHFSSGQVTLWSVEDPMRYRVHVKDEFLAPDFQLGYPRRAYPAEATVPIGEVASVLSAFKRLRTSDAHIYLRSGSLNLINGSVGLNFSCDGSHYLHYRDFLALGKDVYWSQVGAAQSC